MSMSFQIARKIPSETKRENNIIVQAMKYTFQGQTLSLYLKDEQEEAKAEKSVDLNLPEVGLSKKVFKWEKDSIIF